MLTIVSFINVGTQVSRDVWTDKPLHGTRGQIRRKVVDMKRILVHFYICCSENSLNGAVYTMQH